VTTTLSPPIRILALVGVLAAAALGILLFTHSRSSSDGSSSATPPAGASHSGSATQTPAVPVKPAAVKPAKPKVVLLPGLPSPVAHALRSSKVVVVALYAHGGTGDAAAVAQALTGAHAAHSGFVAVNVANEKVARAVSSFVGTTTAPPAVLVVKRPGKIVNQFGYADSEIVAQAAANAGAGR
jgi:hypothetical protein